MNVAELKTSIRNELAETNSAGFFSDSDILNLINRAQIDIAERTRCLKTWAETSAVAGVQSYALPSDCLMMERITYDGVKLDRFPLGSITNLDGKPEGYCIWGADIILDKNIVEPKLLKMYYAQKPDKLSLDADEPQIPTEFQELIVEFACWKALLSDDNPRATSHQNNYLEGIAEMKRSLGYMYDVPKQMTVIRNG